MHGILTALRYCLLNADNITSRFLSEIVKTLEESVQLMLGKLFTENASFADMNAAIDAIIDECPEVIY